MICAIGKGVFCFAIFLEKERGSGGGGLHVD